MFTPSRKFDDEARHMGSSRPRRAGLRNRMAARTPAEGVTGFASEGIRSMDGELKASRATVARMFHRAAGKLNDSN